MKISLKYSALLSLLVYLMSVAPLKATQCLKAINLLSERIDVPKKLLLQIAKIESGFGSQRMPWPWSIHIQGKSYYFKTEKAASIYIKQLLALDIKNFDVGCMQINYFWHQDKVRTPQELLNPLKNTLIAAQFLSHLKAQHYSWHKVVSHYHSSDPERGAAYARLVFKHERYSS